MITLTLDLPTELYQRLQEEATQAGRCKILLKHGLRSDFHPT